MTPEPASQHLASDRRDWETSGRHDPGASVTTQGDKRETQPRSQRHSIWHPDTGRQAGDTTPEPASQHLASDRRDWETQGDKRETRPWSQRHSIWHLTGETGRQEDKRKTGPRNRRHTFLFSILQVRTPMLRCFGNNNNKSKNNPLKPLQITQSRSSKTGTLGHMLPLTASQAPRRAAPSAERQICGRTAAPPAGIVPGCAAAGPTPGT